MIVPMVAPDTSAIDPLLARLREHYRPLEIWLFGSRARGDAHATSDWDLAAGIRSVRPGPINALRIAS